MPSKLQQETSRQNGAKSHGPVTPEGQAQCSKNALRHGLSASAVVLPWENAEEFEQLRGNYIQDFRPCNQSQLDQVETLAATRWRMNRLVSMETRLFEQETLRNEEAMEKEFTELDGAGELAWTFNKMANTSKTPALLLRYEGQLNRTYDRAFKQLRILQSTSPAALPPPEPSSDRQGVANRNTPNLLPELQNEPNESAFSPFHPPSAAPSNPVKPEIPEAGGEILAA
jgi:hypothetical protein